MAPSNSGGGLINAGEDASKIWGSAAPINAGAGAGAAGPVGRIFLGLAPPNSGGGLINAGEDARQIWGSAVPIVAGAGAGAA